MINLLFIYTMITKKFEVKFCEDMLFAPLKSYIHDFGNIYVVL